MTIQPVTPRNPVCFGVCCAQHPNCERYHQVENAPDDVHRIDSCESGGERPLFLLRLASEVPA